ncbi:hypothetical protein F2P56_036694 [Juglans regia]|uniref:Uncharacterized protein n=2 Tax=Juglans regia TaxID=51240 RepID=A0A833T7S6_JUGRE|nr:uncharacterized protein LOC108995705 [Juglans regia]KAF5444200.1 hypothetical protein F2P56_036694 [Juglans regia]
MLRAGCSLVSCNSRSSILEVLLGRHERTSFSSYTSQLVHHPDFAMDHKLGNGSYLMKGAGSRYFMFSTNGQTWKKLHSNTVNNDKGKVQPPALASPKLTFPRNWIKWVFGSGVTLSISTWKQDWRKRLRIGGETEMVVEEVESVAEIVEKVATVAEKISAEVADKLPENGKLKEAALFVERVSKEAAHDAHLTKDFIHKVDALKEDLEALLVEPMNIDQIAKLQGSEGK